MSAGGSSASPGRRSSARLPAGWVLRRARELADPVAKLRSRAPGPVPPRRLRARTGAPGVREFVDGGRGAAAELERALEPVGRSFQEFASVLDLGCGSARVLPHVAALASSAQCAGCDVDPAAVEWAAAHHPRLDWAVSRFEPPLPFRDQSFELLYSISVFSHLDEPQQDLWLSEVVRVLRPGGIALLSVHGGSAFDQFRSGEATTAWCRPEAFQRASLRLDEFVFEPYIRSVWNEGDLPGVGDAYGLTFHGEQYVHEHWSRWVEVAAVLERALTGWQDVVVCRRPG